MAQFHIFPKLVYFPPLSRTSVSSSSSFTWFFLTASSCSSYSFATPSSGPPFTPSVMLPLSPVPPLSLSELSPYRLLSLPPIRSPSGIKLLRIMRQNASFSPCLQRFLGFINHNSCWKSVFISGDCNASHSVDGLSPRRREECVEVQIYGPCRAWRRWLLLLLLMLPLLLPEQLSALRLLILD